MTFGYRTRTNRGGFRSPRGGRGSSFGNRGRGNTSDSFYGSGRGGSHSERSYRGSSNRGSGYRERNDYYDSRNIGNKHSQERYNNSSSHSSRKDGEYHYRDSREPASGSYSRDYSRRSDVEPDRKRMRSEIGIYKEGVSPRRSYGDVDHSNRGYNSNSSYHNSPSPFKSYKKDYGEFKKPLPVEKEFQDRRPSKSFRGRGAASRPVVRSRPNRSTLLNRTVSGRINKPSASRLQQLLRKKKKMQIARMRRAREERVRTTTSKHREERNNSSMDENFTVQDEVEDETIEQEIVTTSPPKKEPMKVEKEVKHEIQEEAKSSESSKMKEQETSLIMENFRQRIPLRCVHCKREYNTFKIYVKHLRGYEHKQAMEKLVHKLKLRLRRMRTTQRDQQRILDEQCDSQAKTTYCKLCKLNYKQSPAEHYTSQYHVKMGEFLNPKCGICHVTFSTPIVFEHHRCTLTHMKRKAFNDRKEPTKQEEEEDEDFMVLDSVGSADESDDDLDQSKDCADISGSTEKKRKPPKMVGSEFIKKVTSHYCELCKVNIKYDPVKNQEELLLIHCRSPYHLKQFNIDKNRKKTEEEKEVMKTEEDDEDNNSTSEIGDLEAHSDKFWGDDDDVDDKHKMSEDEDDSHSENRYDRFRHSDAKESIDKKLSEEEMSNLVKGEPSVKVE